jgi:predicted choloylglycine hydrolase
MENLAYHIILAGTNYEVGKEIGRSCMNIPGLADTIETTGESLSTQEEEQMYKLFDEFCPGINEEIQGFADILKIRTAKTLYYSMSYLRPRCSQIAVLPSKTINGHTLLARNYDFNNTMDQMTLSTTKINGRYAHIGSSVLQFGRFDGMNEHGLAVGQTSAGFPVGNLEFNLKPAIVGLQSWAVVRSVLENCKNVNEVIQWTKDMPIAYNINLMAADKNGNAVLVESFNGNKAIREISAESKEQYLCSTNHVHLQELKSFTPVSMKNSIERYTRICDTLNGTEQISPEDLKRLLSAKYPEGLCCHFYDEFFGTLRSMVYDVNDGTLNMCFGSPALNNWHTFKISDEVKQPVYQYRLEREKAPEDFFAMIESC